MTTLSIIGSARDDRFNKNHFNFMYDKALSFIKDKGLDKDVLTLVSGGSAWSDHVAIRLFLNYPNKFNLKLYLPCKSIDIDEDDDDGNFKFHENKSDNYDPGISLNKYHKIFQNQLNENKILTNKISTIGEIIKAKEMGAILDFNSDGFHSRNKKVAQSDYIIAFTFSKSSQPESSGTLDTWNQSKSLNKFHFTIPNQIPDQKS
ncbi:hypothetical protein ACTFIU_000469 [Dictyostelium citrinum]